MEDTEKQKISAEIINILSYQQVITNQGINYTGEKDWALNKILALLDKTIKSKLEAVEDIAYKVCNGDDDCIDNFTELWQEIKAELINKHK